MCIQSLDPCMVAVSLGQTYFYVYFLRDRICKMPSEESPVYPGPQEAWMRRSALQGMGLSWGQVCGQDFTNQAKGEDIPVGIGPTKV